MCSVTAPAQTQNRALVAAQRLDVRVVGELGRRGYCVCEGILSWRFPQENIVLNATRRKELAKGIKLDAQYRAFVAA